MYFVGGLTPKGIRLVEAVLSSVGVDAKLKKALLPSGDKCEAVIYDPLKNGPLASTKLRAAGFALDFEFTATGGVRECNTAFVTSDVYAYAKRHNLTF